MMEPIEVTVAVETSEQTIGIARAGAAIGGAVEEARIVDVLSTGCDGGEVTVTMEIEVPEDVLVESVDALEAFAEDASTLQR